MWRLATLALWLLLAATADALLVTSPRSIAGTHIACRPGEFAFSSATRAVSGAIRRLPAAAQGCAPYGASQRGAVRGRVALVDRGGCTFATKARHAEHAGARAMVVKNNVQGELFSMTADDSTSPLLPSVLVSQADGAWLAACGCNVTIAESCATSYANGVASACHTFSQSRRGAITDEQEQ